MADISINSLEQPFTMQLDSVKIYFITGDRIRVCKISCRTR